MRKNHIDHTLKPEKCFCQIPGDDLQKWAEKRFYENRETIDLLSEAKSDYEKEIVSIVSLLDIDDTTMIEMMGDVDKPTHHILECRRNVRELLNLKKNKQ